MSLFKARDWWSVTAGSGEEWDGQSLVCGNIDNDPNELVKIATGSLSGMLRIYHPKDKDYRPEDLLLEQELEQAILQLELGYFSAAGGKQLAVLHPRKLVIYNVTNMGTQYLQLTKLYEHALDHTSANMCCGHFGGVQGYDYLCVQSYDGQLSFYECESFAFARYLPSFLIPGPLAYIAPADALVTCSASFELECYKYKSLASASAEKQDEDKAGPGAGRGLQAAKRVTADWKVVLGESAVDIRCARLTQGLQVYQADIVVLCEHHVFVVSSTTGSVIFQKRLEYHPACCITYEVPAAKLPGGPQNLLVASHNRTVLVYRGNVLCWAARLELQPIAIRVVDIATTTGVLSGMLVTLSDTGRLSVCFLGTDPMLNPVGFVEGKDLDYEAMGKEQRSLAAIIREHTAGRRIEPLDKLLIRAQVPSLMDGVRDGGGGAMQDFSSTSFRMQSRGRDGAGGGGPGDDGMMRSMGGRGPKTLTARLYLTYQGDSSGVSDVHVTVRAPDPVSCPQDTFHLPLVLADANDPTVLSIPFYPATSTSLPCSATASVVTHFIASSGEPRAQVLPLALPLCLFVSVVPPVKAAVYKVTVSCNRAPPLLSSLFEDLLAQAGPGMAQSLAAGSAGANVMSVQYPSGAAVTILVSKNGGKYRLQSDALEAMWLILSQLVRRLRGYYETAEAGEPASEGPLAFSSEDPLPLEDFFEVVDAHFAARQRVRELRQQLEERAVALRAIQKRLLMRFKDKAPAPLNQLDFLMEETYAGLMELGTLMEGAQARVKQQALRLSACTQLLVLLTSYKFGLSPDETAVLQSALSPDVLDAEELGWEEMTEAAMTQLLRSSLARNSKEAAVALGPMTAAKDTTKLKKHISLVLERLSRGQRMALEADDMAGGTTGSSTPSGMARQLSKHGSKARGSSKAS